MTTVRHFTATGFVVYMDATLLHWHPKVKMWLLPGGHIEPNEDPVQVFASGRLLGCLPDQALGCVDNWIKLVACQQLN